MHQTIINFLNTLAHEPLHHAKWLNTLSLLEYIGARKIIKSQEAHSLDLMMMEHIAEETRHAYFFKKLSEKTLPGACPNYSEDALLAGKSSKDYFQSLDHMVTHELQVTNTRLNYLYVTWLIEERAIFVYTLYLQIIRPFKLYKERTFKLQGILNEENSHLETMRFLIYELDPEKAPQRQKIFANKEEAAFKCLLDSWMEAVPQKAMPPQVIPQKAVFHQEATPPPQDQKFASPLLNKHALISKRGPYES